MFLFDCHAHTQWKSLAGFMIRNVLAILDSPPTPRYAVYFVGLSWALMPRRDGGRPVCLNGSRLVEILCLRWSTGRKLHEAESRRFGCKFGGREQCPPGRPYSILGTDFPDMELVSRFASDDKVSERLSHKCLLAASHSLVGQPSAKIPSTRTSSAAITDQAACSGPPCPRYQIFRPLRYRKRVSRWKCFSHYCL